MFVCGGVSFDGGNMNAALVREGTVAHKRSTWVQRQINQIAYKACCFPQFLQLIIRKKLRETARFVSDLVNLPLDPRAAFVGDSAFAHKGGVHVSAVERNPSTYEHIPPEAVGNS